MAYALARSLEHTIRARLLKAQALLQLDQYCEAIKTVRELLVGGHLPQSFCEFELGFDTPGLNAIFNDDLPMTHAKNVRVLLGVADRQLPQALRDAYGCQLSCEVVLVQCGLLVKMAASSGDALHECNLLQTPKTSDEDPASLSALPTSSTVGLSPLNTSRLAKSADLSRADMKLFLLESVESLLVELTQYYITECGQGI